MGCQEHVIPYSWLKFLHDCFYTIIYCHAKLNMTPRPFNMMPDDFFVSQNRRIGIYWSSCVTFNTLTYWIRDFIAHIDFWSMMYLVQITSTPKSKSRIYLPPKILLRVLSFENPLTVIHKVTTVHSNKIGTL